MCLNSSAFMILVPASALPFDDAGLDRQLGRAEPEGLPGGPLGHAVEFEHDAPRLDAGHPQLGRTLARAHAHLGWLLGHRHIREDADPDAAGALHAAGDGTPRRLDLAGREPLRLDRLEAVGAKIQGGAALGVAMNATLVSLAVLGAYRLQHFSSVLSSAKPWCYSAWRSAQLAASPPPRRRPPPPASWASMARFSAAIGS